MQRNDDERRPTRFDSERGHRHQRGRGDRRFVCRRLRGSPRHSCSRTATFSLIPGMGGTFATSTDINERGDVVGYARRRASIRGYLFDGSAARRPQHEDPARATRPSSRSPVEIADDGTILARGADSRLPRSRPAPRPDERPAADTWPDDRHEPAGRSERRHATGGSRRSSPSTERMRRTRSTIPRSSTSRRRSGRPSGATTPCRRSSAPTTRSDPGPASGGAELYDPVAGDGVGRLARPVLAGRDRHVAVHAPCPGQAAGPGDDEVISAPLTFSVTAPSAKGQVERDPRDDRFLRYTDGTPYLPDGPQRRVRRRQPVQRRQPLLRAAISSRWRRPARTGPASG